MKGEEARNCHERGHGTRELVTDEKLYWSPMGKWLGSGCHAEPRVGENIENIAGGNKN